MTLEREQKQLQAVKEAERVCAKCEDRLARALSKIRWWHPILSLLPANKAKLASIRRLQIELDQKERCIQTEKNALKPIAKEVQRTLKLEMSESSAYYKLGLKLRELQRESLTQLKKLDAQVRELIRRIGTARSAMVASYDQKSQSYSTAAKQFFKHMLPVLDEINLVIDAFNSRSQKHNTVACSNRLQSIALPRLEAVNIRAELEGLESKQIVVAHRTIESMVEVLEAMLSEVLVDAKADVNESMRQTGQRMDSLVSSCRLDLRKTFGIGV